MTVASGQDVVGLVFFEILFMAFAAMFAQIFTFPLEYDMMVKERQSGMYRLSSFFIARILADMPLEWAFPFIYVTLIYWLGGLRPTAWAYLANLSCTLLVITTASSTGLCVGAIAMKIKRAQVIATVMMLTLMLVAGFYVSNVPSWLAWIKYASFMFYGYRIVLAIEFTGRDYYDCGGLAKVSDPANDPRCTPVTDL